MDTLALRKARGAFYTPPEISRFLSEWAIRTHKDLVLEPSCGEAAFLLEGGRRLRDLGARGLGDGTQLHGVEIHASSAVAASAFLHDQGLHAEIQVADFFEVTPGSKFDAVIGNPPYVRYQNFAGEARARGLQAALAEGVRLTGLASSWAPFVIHASRFLNRNGRLALVLPAELLSVNYAAQVRRFLMERFSKVRLVMFETRVFPGVLEEVVLLLAEGAGGATNFEVYQARGIDDLKRIDTNAWTDYSPSGGDKWTPALLPSSAFTTYQNLTAGSGFMPLLSWGETYLGAVTGNNSYFSLTREEASELRLRSRDLLPISPPGSRHLKGLKFSAVAWESLSKEGARSYLFYPAEDKLSAAARRYVESGEERGVNKAYKCENRTPWWRVPLVQKPDLLFTYMNHDRPRLIANEGRVHILNSIYGIALKAQKRRLGRELLPIGSLNSVTLLGAEIVGRAYGGGLLKMEPKEADLLPLPSEQLLKAAERDLLLVKPQLAIHLRQGDLMGAVHLVDEILLEKHIGVSDRDIKSLRQAREFLFQRRRTRSKDGAN